MTEELTDLFRYRECMRRMTVFQNLIRMVVEQITLHCPTWKPFWRPSPHKVAHRQCFCVSIELTWLLTFMFRTNSQVSSLIGWHGWADDTCSVRRPWWWFRQLCGAQNGNICTNERDLSVDEGKENKHHKVNLDQTLALKVAKAWVVQSELITN